MHPPEPEILGVVCAASRCTHMMLGLHSYQSRGFAWSPLLVQAGAYQKSIAGALLWPNSRLGSESGCNETTDEASKFFFSIHAVLIWCSHSTIGTYWRKVYSRRVFGWVFFRVAKKTMLFPCSFHEGWNSTTFQCKRFQKMWQLLCHLLLNWFMNWFMKIYTKQLNVGAKSQKSEIVVV